MKIFHYSLFELASFFYHFNFKHPNYLKILFLTINDLVKKKPWIPIKISG